MFSLVQNVGTYCGTVYVAIYLRTVLKMPAAEVGFIVLIAVTCAALFIPVFGIMTDRIGATKTLVGCYVCYIVLSYPCYALMGGSFSMTVLALVVTMIPYALCQAGSYSMYPELLPPKVRSTGVSFAASDGCRSAARQRLSFRDVAHLRLQRHHDPDLYPHVHGAIGCSG